MKRNKTIGLAVFLALAATSTLFGQATEGSVLGSVLDASGAAVVGAHVDVVSVETSFIRSTITNGAGEYVVANLPIGHYDVSAQMTGFRKSVHAAVALDLEGARARGFEPASRRREPVRSSGRGGAAAEDG